MSRDKLLISTLTLFLLPFTLPAAVQQPSTAASSESKVSQKPRSWLGFGFRWLRDKTGDRILHVAFTFPASPAERAGMRPGDLVTTIAGQPVGFGDDLEFLLFLSELKIGRSLPVDIVRDGRHLSLVIVVAAMPEDRREAWQRSLDNARRKRLLAANRSPR